MKKRKKDKNRENMIKMKEGRKKTNKEERKNVNRGKKGKKIKHQDKYK